MRRIIDLFARLLTVIQSIHTSLKLLIHPTQVDPDTRNTIQPDNISPQKDSKKTNKSHYKVGPWIYFNMPINDGFLSWDVILGLINYMIKYLEPKFTYSVLLKVQYEDGSIRSLAPMFFLSFIFNLEAFKTYIMNALTLKDEWYSAKRVKSIYFMVKVQKNSSILGSSAPLKTSGNRAHPLHNSIPHSINLERLLEAGAGHRWGTLISRSINNDQLATIQAKESKVQSLQETIKTFTTFLNMPNTPEEGRNLLIVDMIRLESEVTSLNREIAELRDNLSSNVIIRSFNEEYEYHISLTRLLWNVQVFNYIFNKTFNRTRLSPFLTFTLEILPGNDHFKITFNQNFIIIENGIIQSCSYPVPVKFMDGAKKSTNNNWNSQRILTMDIETRTINGVMTPYAVGIYDGVEFTSFYLSDYNTVDDMMIASIQFLMGEKYNKFYAYLHNFSKFDSVFLLKYLVKLSSYNSLKPIMRDGRIISLPFHYKYFVSNKPSNGVINFIDSYLLLPQSLQKLGKAFNVPTQKDIFPYEFVNNLEVSFDYVGPVPSIDLFNDISQDEYNQYLNRFTNGWSLKSETLNYLSGDCISLFQVLNVFGNSIFGKFKVDITKTPTLPSLAMRLFRTNFMKSKNIPLINGVLYSDISQAYYGGLVDVYQPHGENLYYYDVNSLYPTAMQNPIPVGTPVYVKGGLDLENFFGYIYAEVQSPSEIKIPILPMKLNGRLICPTGKWRAWYFSEELRDARDFYGYNITPLVP